MISTEGARANGSLGRTSSDVIVVGLGVVGLGLSQMFDEQRGLRVIGVDLPHVVDRLTRLEDVPYAQDNAPWLRRAMVDERLTLRSDVKSALAARTASTVVLTVGTHAGRDDRYDTGPLLAVMRSVRECAVRPLEVFVASTIDPITADALLSIAAEPGPRIDVVASPIFAPEGAMHRLIDRHAPVLGVDAQGPRREELTRLGGDLFGDGRAAIVMGVKEAALTKMFRNNRRTFAIEASCEEARISAAAGADYEQVREAIACDQDLFAPGAFSRPGLGSWGPCLPKENRATLALARDYRVPAPLLQAALVGREISVAAPVEKLDAALDGVEGRTICIIGAAYKAGGDVRSSGAVEVARALARKGARVKVYDPSTANRKSARAALQTTCDVTDTLEAAAQGADAIAVLTEWSEVRTLDWRSIRAVARGDVIVDARNVVDLERATQAGFRVSGNGRAVYIGVRATKPPSLEAASALARIRALPRDHQHWVIASASLGPDD